MASRTLPDAVPVRGPRGSDSERSRRRNSVTTRIALAALATLAPTAHALPHQTALPAVMVAQREVAADPGAANPVAPRTPAPARTRPGAPLGVPQVSAPAEATPSVPASSSPRVPPRTLLAPSAPATPGAAPRQTLAPAALRPGPAAAASAARPSTSADCAGQPSRSECLLPGPKPADWHQQTGVEIDPVTGAKLVPGVHLNPPKAP